ncbi:hypothetical protein FOL47_001734 [Perkinsus chesapeaki]|uniref:Uncharacterized protein n=1 Tax=Perkinsus chesapeaki TaxID=330153 RepID=A0A7J6MHJ7_PERCH|nr:hypothetical protein FOL47_001734 [Perkinsus chesapeaki]
MKLYGLSLSVACFAIAAREPSRLLGPRRLTTITYPKGCTPENKPDDQVFCVTANLDASEGLRLDLSVNIFDAEDTSKSTHLDLQASLNGSTPTGLNITGGGCANVFNNGFDGVLEGTVQLCFEPSPEGTGELDPNTGYWHASLGASVEGTVTIFGKDNHVGTSDTVDVHFGPNFDFGFAVSLEKSTEAKKRQGVAAGLSLDLNTVNNTIFNWELAAKAKARVWFHPFIDKEKEFDLFKKEFQIPLR